MKNRVLFIGRFPEPIHGASKVNEDYFKSKLINKGFYLERVKINKSEEVEEIGKFSLKKFRGIFEVYFELRKKLKEFDPNLIYFEIAPTGFAFLRDSFYAFLCKISGKRIIFQIHGRGIKEKTRNFFWKQYYENVFRNAKMILLSESIYPEVEKIIRRENIYILNNGIRNTLTDKEFKKIISKRNKNKKKKLLFLSNMMKDKGVLDVLDVCETLKNQKIDFECNFVGPWEKNETKKEFEETLKSKELKEYCNYLGPKYGKDKEKMLSESDFMIFPTKYKNESFPLVILEAFMYGIPVFSYDIGAIREIISQKYLGYVSKEKNPEDLADELGKAIVKNPDQRKIREYFRKNYSFDIAERNLKEIFDRELK